jgi:hypothetical protein
VWEELITQSRYPIKDARPPARPSARHSPFYKPDALCATRPKSKYMYIYDDYYDYYVYLFQRLSKVLVFAFKPKHVAFKFGIFSFAKKK